MHPQDDQTALPSRRDWTGWLFVLIVVAVVVAVIYASHSTGTRKHVTHRQPVAPPADIVPEVQPMVLAPVTEDDARTQNAAVALVTKGFVAARPFVYAGGGDAKARARDCLAAAMLYEAGDDAKGQQAPATPPSPSRSAASCSRGRNARPDASSPSRATGR